MELRPGALLGLPAGVPSVVFDAAAWRDLLVLLALAAGWATARRRQGWALALAIAWAALAIGFWTVALGRPYGLFADASITRWAAEVSVAAHAGGEDGMLPGEPAHLGRWLPASRRLGARAVLLAPTVLPVVLYPAIALLIAGLWRGSHRRVAAIFWMAAVTGALDAVRGTGLLPALWPAPAVGLAAATAVAIALVAGRWLPPRPAATAAGVVALALAVAVPGPRTAISPADLTGVLLFDALAWLVLGLIGLRTGRDPAACGLAAGGALAAIAAALGLADPVVAVALYRTGIVLAATPVIVAVAESAGGGLRVPLPGGRGWAPGGAGVLGAVVAVALMGSFVTWWDPPRMDPRVRESLEPIRADLVETTDWIRAHTDPRGVFIAGEDHAAAVAILAGRRVLRAPALVPAGDDQRRVRTQRRILSGQRVDSLLDRYGVRYVLATPGQFRDMRLEEPWGIESATDAFPVIYRGRGGLRVYEVPR